MRTTHAFVLIAALFATGPLPAQASAEQAKVVRAFRKQFEANKKRSRTFEERLAAIALLEGFDSVAIAQALVGAFASLDTEIDSSETKRAQIVAELRKITRGKESDEKRIFAKSVHHRYMELRTLLNENRELVDALRKLQSAVAMQVLDLKQYKSLSWLMKTVLGQRKYSLLLKLTVASSTGAFNKSMLADISLALKRARRQTELIALLEGIGNIGKDGRELGPAVLALLKHKDIVIQERAALALSSLRVYDAIPQIIALLEKSKGQVQKRLGYALESMTGQQHGTAVASWRGWYEDEGKELIAKGELDRVSGEMFRSRRVVRPSGGYYMGIPQDGEAIIYVIDSSGSMKQPVTWGNLDKPAGARRTQGTSADKRDTAKGEKGEGFATTRLEACKMELIKALERLDRSKTFNIIWYNDLPHLWNKSMQKAVPPRIREAQRWIRQLKPSSSTNIHDSMQMAFEFAKGGGSKGKAFGTRVGVDTIFLLSDGSPTTPDGKFDDPMKVIEAVRRWNPLKRVTVHTIGIGNSLNTKFMSRLAKDNNGKFSHYTDSGKKKR